MTQANELEAERMSAWMKKPSSLHSTGRKLSDDQMYIIDLDDMYPAGILIQAYNQATSHRYTLSVSEGELARTGLSRTIDDLTRLADSVDVCQVGDTTFVHSTLDGIAMPKVVPTGEQARAFIQGIKAGDYSLDEFLTNGLSELCKVKPEGLDAVRWLGEWLLANNPNKPKIGHADDVVVEEPEDEVLHGAQLRQ